MKYNFNEFCKKLQECVQDILGDDCLAELKEVHKNNGVILKGLEFREKNNRIAPVVYLESSFENYSIAEESIPEIATEIVSQYRNVRTDFPFNLEMLKEELIIGVCVNALNNKSLLADIPYRMLTEDYCVIYKFILDDNHDGAMATITITDELAATYGYTEDKLFECAIKNTPGLLPYNLVSMLEMLGLPEELMGAEDTLGKMHVLSNSKNLNGAFTIFYPDVKNRLSETFEENYLICIPSSIHEWILIPQTTYPEISLIEEMISQVNGTEVDEQDVLGYSPMILTRDSVTGLFMIEESGSCVAC